MSWRDFMSLRATEGVSLEREDCVGVQVHQADKGRFRGQILGPSSKGTVCAQNLGAWDTVEMCARVRDVAALFNAVHRVGGCSLDEPDSVRFNFVGAGYLQDKPLLQLLQSMPSAPDDYCTSLGRIRDLFKEGGSSRPPASLRPAKKQQQRRWWQRQQRQQEEAAEQQGAARPAKRQKLSTRALQGRTWYVEGGIWFKTLTAADLKGPRIHIKPRVLEVLFGYQRSPHPSMQAAAGSDSCAAKAAFESAADGAADDGKLCADGSQDGRQQARSEQRALPAPLLLTLPGLGKRCDLPLTSVGRDGFLFKIHAAKQLTRDLRLGEGDTLRLEPTGTDPSTGRPTASISVQCGGQQQQQPGPEAPGVSGATPSMHDGGRLQQQMIQQAQQQQQEQQQQQMSQQPGPEAPGTSGAAACVRNGRQDGREQEQQVVKQEQKSSLIGALLRGMRPVATPSPPPPAHLPGTPSPSHQQPAHSGLQSSMQRGSGAGGHSTSSVGARPEPLLLQMLRASSQKAAGPPRAPERAWPQVQPPPPQQQQQQQPPPQQQQPQQPELLTPPRPPQQQQQPSGPQPGASSQGGGLPASGNNPPRGLGVLKLAQWVVSQQRVNDTAGGTSREASAATRGALQEPHQGKP